MENNTAVSINDLTVAYEDKPVLWDIDLDIKKGVLMAVVGPNGAGKSTLIKAMLNLINPLSGSVSFFGNSYKKQRSKIAYVPQRGSVDWDFPTTALDVVEMGRYGKIGWIKRVGKADRKIAADAIKKVGMEGFEKRQISQLSGGQQQRTAIGRAIVKNPDILLCDEPTGALDYNTSKEILKLIETVNQKYGNTIVMVTHNDAIKDMADRVVKLRDGMIRKNYLNEHKIPAAELDW